MIIDEWKDGSAISDFKEYSMIKPRKFGTYVGFNEAEVQMLCDMHGADFAMMKQWYDGYEFRGTGAVYNPNSVMEANSACTGERTTFI